MSNEIFFASWLLEFFPPLRRDSISAITKRGPFARLVTWILSRQNAMLVQNLAPRSLHPRHCRGKAGTLRVLHVSRSFTVYIYACICVYTYLYIYVYIYTYVYTFIYTYVCIHIFICTKSWHSVCFACEQIVHVVHIHVYVCLCKCIYLYVYIYAYAPRLLLQHSWGKAGTLSVFCAKMSIIRKYMCLYI